MTTRLDGSPDADRTAEDPRITAFGLFVEVSGLLNRLLSKEMESRCDIPITWFEVLLRLGRAPGHRMRMVELAAQISFTDGGVSRLADRMERAGLIGRELDRTDRREHPGRPHARRRRAARPRRGGPPRRRPAASRSTT